MRVKVGLVLLSIVFGSAGLAQTVDSPITDTERMRWLLVENLAGCGKTGIPEVIPRPVSFLLSLEL
jgi:hypothetical protein